MRVNKLKLNDKKTEFIMFGTKNNLGKMEDITVRIGEDEIRHVQSVRNLGFYMSSTMSVRKHVSTVCSSSYFTLKKLNRVKHYIDADTKKVLSQGLVMSKVDYCNSLLVGAPKQELKRLQSIQNMCERFVTGLKKYDHVSPTLRSLHWLKIPFRAEYKILVLMFKCVHGLAPEYLTDMLELSHHRQLRSSSVGKLPIPVKCSLSSTFNRCFVQIAPRRWNALPQALRSEGMSLESFKTRLKTHLFKLCYDSG
jgi:hypothetical protein